MNLNNSPIIYENFTNHKEPFRNLNDLKNKCYSILINSESNPDYQRIISRHGAIKDWVFMFPDFGNLFNDPSRFSNISEENWYKLKDMKYWDVSHVINMNLFSSNF